MLCGQGYGGEGPGSSGGTERGGGIQARVHLDKEDLSWGPCDGRNSQPGGRWTCGGERMKVKVGGKQGSQEKRMQNLGDESMAGSRNRGQFGCDCSRECEVQVGELGRGHWRQELRLGAKIFEVLHELASTFQPQFYRAPLASLGSSPCSAVPCGFL